MKMQMAELYGELCDVVERARHNLPVKPIPGEPSHTSAYAREAANRLLDLMAKARDADVQAREESHEAEVMDVLAERDRAQTAADILAGIVADLTGAEIGEHSSDNDPWYNAMKASETHRGSSDYEYGIRWVNSGNIHRTGMTERQAREFVNPEDWGELERPVGEVFEVVRRHRSRWQVVP